jgi:hypothetical protein
MFVVYALACLLVGILGANRKMGFWGYTFASAVLTPVVGLILVVVSAPLPPSE